MLRISPHITSACVLSTVLTGCTLYQQMEVPIGNRELNVGQYSAVAKVNHEKVFHDLQQFDMFLCISTFTCLYDFLISIITFFHTNS